MEGARGEVTIDKGGRKTIDKNLYSKNKPSRPHLAPRPVVATFSEVRPFWPEVGNGGFGVCVPWGDAVRKFDQQFPYVEPFFAETAGVATCQW